MDRLDGANAPSLTKKVQHHANVITPVVTVPQEQDTKQVIIIMIIIIIIIIIITIIIVIFSVTVTLWKLTDVAMTLGSENGFPLKLCQFIIEGHGGEMA